MPVTISAEDLIIRTPTKRLRPVGDCVVFRAERADRLQSGLYAPDKAEKLRKAIVVAVGPGETLEDGTIQPPDVKVGDHIVLWPPAVTGEVGFTGEQLFICHAEDVAAVVEPIPAASDEGQAS